VDVVVIGSGIAGVSCAHYLARDHGARVLVVDERPPLSYTSALSTECYRNFWAGSAPMTAFMERSIDLLEARARESDNAFGLNRKGYWFVTATASGAAQQLKTAEAVDDLGIGGARVYTDGSHGVRYRPDLPFDAHADSLAVFSGADAVRAFAGSLPGFLTPNATSLMYSGRAGWMSAQQMGATLLERAREAGVATLGHASLVGLSTSEAAVSGVQLSVGGAPMHVPCGAVVNCAGPFAHAVDRILRGRSGGNGSRSAGGGDDGGLPLENEIHAKAVLRDDRCAVPDGTPMVIWQDEVDLGWSEEEAAELASMGDFEARLTTALPAGAHFRPYPGSPSSLIMLWEALHSDISVAAPPPEVPPLRDELYGELVLRAMSRMVPRLGEYFDSDGTMSASIAVDGGYYTKAPDNMPLVGPVADAPAGAFMCAGLSGYGVMAANAAGDLLARHVAGAPLPAGYATEFLPERWHSAAYRAGVEGGTIAKGFQI